MLLTVFADVFEIEPARQSEIKLRRRQLPFAAERIEQFHVDLRAVERRLIRNYRRVDSKPLHSIAQAVFGELPLVRRAVVLAAGAAVPGRHFRLELLESERTQR